MRLLALSLASVAALAAADQAGSVRELLDAMDLAQHRAALDVSGAATVSDLAYLTEADFDAMGVPLVHRRKMQAAAQRQSSSPYPEHVARQLSKALPSQKRTVGSRSASRFLTENVSSVEADLDTLWLLLGAFFVFLMQAGFALLEVGSVRHKNTKNILVKNVFDASIGALTFWLFGFAFAFGEGGFFVGGTEFGMGGAFDEAANGIGYNGNYYAYWLFQFAFAATAATIVSGAVAERVSFQGYMIYATVLTSFVYPVVAHWGWSADGWASAFRSDGDLLFDVGAIDFAGSGVVHMVGGVASFWAAYFIGPRHGRYNADGSSNTIAQQNAVYQTLGLLILWFGWYGFNCASTLALSGGLSGVAARIGVTTTISAATGGLTSISIGMYREKILDTGAVNNGILAGLVGVTSGCATVDPEGAFVIGFIAAFIYTFCSHMLKKYHIDDVVDAFPVHCGCGAWGVLAAGLFSTSENYRAAYGAESCGLFGGCENAGNQFMANLVFMLAVAAWTTATCVPLFWGITKTVGLRAPLQMEIDGMDAAKHGGLTMEEFMIRKLSVGPTMVLPKRSPAVNTPDRNPDADEVSTPIGGSGAQVREVPTFVPMGMTVTDM